MKNVRIYDNGGKTYDRYTAVFMKRPIRQYRSEAIPPDMLYECLGMSENPFHPLGFGQHSTSQDGKHLGKRISFAKCPPDVQRCIKQSLGE